VGNLKYWDTGHLPDTWLLRFWNWVTCNHLPAMHKNAMLSIVLHS
jgi:hypothetical protein